MSNLITEKQKKAIGVEYIIRLTAVILFMVSLLGLFLLAYVIPYYFIMIKNDLRVAGQVAAELNIENQGNNGTSSSQIVNQTLDEMRATEFYNKDSAYPTDDFIKIISSKNPNIQIKALTFNLVKTGQAEFLISGMAKNRDGLVAFIGDLQSQSGFSSVDSPVSDLAKNSAIPFTVTIKTAI